MEVSGEIVWPQPRMVTYCQPFNDAYSSSQPYLFQIVTLYSTPSALNTASSALWYGINWNALIKSDGTVAKSTIEVAGINTFFAPLSRHTCNKLASSSALINVPLILISPQHCQWSQNWFSKCYGANSDKRRQCQLISHSNPLQILIINNVVLSGCTDRAADTVSICF